MTRLSPAWSHAHNLLLGILIPVVFGTIVAAWANDLMIATAIALLLILTAGVGMAFNGFISLGVGLSGAALNLVMKQLTNAWPENAVLSGLIESLFFIGTGVAAGSVGEMLYRERQRLAAIQQSMPEPAIGSLGLVNASLAQARLEEEVDRAHAFGRPLSLLWIGVEVEPQRQNLTESISRSLTRPLETLLRLTDVPFAFDATTLAAILPEVDKEEAETISGRFLSATEQVTFLVRDEKKRYFSHELARVRVGTATLAPTQTAGELIEEARRAALLVGGAERGADTAETGKQKPAGQLAAAR